MWIMSELGIFSVVKNKRADGSFLVRSRYAKDIAGVIDVLEENGYLFESAITPRCDYPYRVIVDDDGLSFLFDYLQSNLDYHNFKDHIKNTPDQSNKVGLYSKIWYSVLDHAVEAGELPGVYGSWQNYYSRPVIRGVSRNEASKRPSLGPTMNAYDSLMMEEPVNQRYDEDDDLLEESDEVVEEQKQGWWHP